MWYFGCSHRIVLMLLAIYQNNHHAICEDNSNSHFNASLRDYFYPSNITNYAEVKTLQKHQKFHNDEYTEIRNRLKDPPDSSISSSSYSRGFAHQDYSGGYGFNGFDIGPYEGEDYDHYHQPEHGPHFVLNHGHHHKYHDHSGLAIKTILWPLAGIALLGAAAALVSNPVLLQLGVVSGRKKRNTIEEEKFIDLRSYKYLNPTAKETNEQAYKKENTTKDNKKTYNTFNAIAMKGLRKKFKKVIPTTVPAIFDANTLDKPPDNLYKFEDKYLIPIPLKFKNNISTVY